MPTLVLTTNGLPGTSTWTDSTLLPGSGLNQLTGDVLAGPGSGSQPASVVALQGNPVSAVAPAVGETLVWDGVQWVPTPGGAGGITQLTGDVTAGPGAGSQPSTVTALQGNPVSSIAPNDGQILTWNGTAWVPGAAASGGSGGGGQTYFLNAGTPGAAPIVGLPGTTKQFALTAEVAGTSITSAALPVGGVFATVASFVTDVGSPGTTSIPAGIWDFNIWAQSSALTPNSVLFRFLIYTYDGVTATLIATGATTPVYDPTTLIQYISSAVVAQTPILVTDRIYVEVEATSTIPGQTVTFDFGSTTPSHAHTTLPSIAGTGIVHVINGVVQSPASPVDLTAGGTEISGILPISNGGTNTNTVPGNGELLIGNGAGYSVGTLTDGANIVITEGAGSITIDAVPSGAANEIQLNNGGTAFGTDPNFTFDGVNLTVATGGSIIDIGQGFVTGGPNLTVESQLNGTVTVGNGDIVNLVAATDIQINGSSGAAGEVLTSNGAGLPATWQAPTGGITGSIAANEVAFGTGANAIGGSANFTWDNATQALTVIGNAVDSIVVQDITNTTFLSVSPTSYTLTVVNPLDATELATLGYSQINVANTTKTSDLSASLGLVITDVGSTNKLSLSTVGSLATITSDNGAATAQPLNLALGELQINTNPGTAGQVLTSNGPGLAPTWQAAAVSGIDQLTGDVVAGPGSGSQAATVQGMGGAGSKVHFVIVGGQYATLQDAVNAAAANDVIVVGPIGPVAPASSWGDVTFPAQKRLTVIGMDGARGVQANIGKVTFSPAAGGTILENIVQLENLFINASFAGSQGVVFGGSDPARLRLVNCYIFNTAATGNGVVVNNSGAGSSCYIDGTTIQGAGTAGSAIRHTQGYTLIKSGTEVSNYQYQLECSAGLVEVTQSKFLGSLANEVVRITGGTVFLLNSTTLQNTTANASGVNITAAGAAFGMTNSTFAIATGTGYCVRGVAGGVFLYGQINYSNSAALAYNVKLQNTLTAFAVTQAFTLAP